MSSYSFKWLKNILIVAFAAYLSVNIALFMFQRDLLYHPMHGWVTATNAGVPIAQDVEYATADGLTLRAWHAHVNDDAPTLLFFHGNRGKLSTRTPTMREALNAGFNVMAASYRGYSGNPSKPSEQGIYKDAEAAVRYLLNHNVKEQDIIAFGHSLGTGVVMEMATRFSFKAAVLLSPFTSIADTAQIHYPYVPAKWLVRDRFDSLSKISSVQEPVLVLHGEKDVVVPYSQGKELFNAANNPKHLVNDPRLGHNNWDYGRVMREINLFLAR